MDRLEPKQIFPFAHDAVRRPCYNAPEYCSDWVMGDDELCPRCTHEALQAEEFKAREDEQHQRLASV